MTAPRPVGEHAAHDGRLLRRRRRRRRRGHRAAVRRRARPARRVRPPDRPQHPDAAGRGVARGPGDRPGGRLLVRGAAHRRPRRARPGRGSRRSSGPAGMAAALDAGLVAERLAATRAAPRRQTSPTGATPVTGVSEFPQPGRGAAGAREPAPAAAAGRRAAAAPLRRGFEALRDRSTRLRHRSRPGLPRDARAGRRAHRAGAFAANLFAGGRHRDRDRGPATDPARSPRRSRDAARRSPACAPATRCTASRRRPSPRRCARPGARHVLAGRARATTRASTPTSTPAATRSPCSGRRSTTGVAR